MFHKEGHRIIFTALVATVAIFLLSDSFIGIAWLNKTIQIVLLILLILILQFFRNPRRHTTANDKIAYAPVDGKVVAIS